MDEVVYRAPLTPRSWLYLYKTLPGRASGVYFLFNFSINYLEGELLF